MRKVFALVASSLAVLVVACGGDSGDDSFSGIGGGQSGAAGSAKAGSGTAGSATAGSATAGSGTAGSATAGSGTAGSGTAGSGTAGSGTAGSGTAGSGTAGSGTAGSGTAGSATTGGMGGKGGAPPMGGMGGSGPFTPPTTCATAHGFPGCCSPNGNAVFWWENNKVQMKMCQQGQLCVWKQGQSGNDLYDCAMATMPAPDPSGMYPYVCGLPEVQGACGG